MHEARRQAERGRISGSVHAGTRLVALLAIFLVPAVAAAADVRVLTRANGLPSNQVTSLAASPDGRLWVGTADAGVFLLDPATGKGKGYGTADGLASNEVVSVAVFRGNVYVGTSAGFSVFDGASWAAIPRADNVVMQNVRLAASPDGKELWACSVTLSGGTVRFDGKDWKFMGGRGRGLFNDVQGFAFLPEGVLLGTGTGAAYLHKGTDVIPVKEGLPAVSIYAVGGRKGKGLVGTDTGLFELEKERWKKVPLPGTFADVPVFAIAGNGGPVVAGTGRGLVKLDAKETKTLTAGDGLPHMIVTAVAATDEYIAAGTTRGLALVRGW